MNSRACFLLLFVLASGCLYTRNAVQRKFTLQILRNGKIIAIANETETSFEVCDFGTTEETCRNPRALGPGDTMSMPYRMVTLLPPVPDAMCSVKLCVTGNLEAQDDGSLSANTPYVQIENQQGLVVSVRETGARTANLLVATSDFRDGEGCFLVTLTTTDESHLDSQDVLDANGSTIAFSTWDETACARSTPEGP